MKVFGQLGDRDLKKNEKGDLEDACPIPPGVDLPRKGRFTLVSTSVFTDSRFVASALLVAGILFIVGLTLVPPPIIQLRPNPPVWNTTPPQAISDTFPNLGYPSSVGAWVPKYQDVRTWDGDLILTGDQVMLIENCSYAIQGSVLLKDQAKLVFKNADIYLKPKNGFYTTDPVPYIYNLMSTDGSDLQIINSTIYSEQRAQAAFFNGSTCHIADSNSSTIFFFGYDTAKLFFENADNSAIYLADDAALRLNSSKVEWVLPTTRDQTSYALDVGDLRLDASDSLIKNLALFYENSTIHVDKPTIGYHENWNSFRDLAPGGRGFNVTLTRTSVSLVTLMAVYSQLEISNVSDLADVNNLWGHITVVNCSLSSLGINGDGSVNGCSIGRLTLFPGSYELSQSRFDVLFLRAGATNVSVDQVKVGVFAGKHLQLHFIG